MSVPWRSKHTPLLRTLCTALLILGLNIPGHTKAQGPAGSQIDELLATAYANLYASNYPALAENLNRVLTSPDVTTPQIAQAHVIDCAFNLYTINLPTALEQCLAAIEADPTNARAFVYLARAYDWLGETDQALKEIMHAIALAPQDPLVNAVWGEILLDAGRPEDARPPLDLAVLSMDDPVYQPSADLDPAYFTVYRNAAFLFLLNEDSDGFLKTIEQAVAVAPDFVPIRDEAAVYHQQFGHPDRVIDHVRAIARIHHTNGQLTLALESNDLLAHLLHESGQWQAAVEAYLAVESLATDLADTARVSATGGRIALLYMLLSEFDLAQQKLEQVLALSVEIGDRIQQANALTMLGSIYRVHGEIEVALAVQEEALSIQREIGDVRGQIGSLNELGAIMTLRGENRLALDYHEQALTLARSVQVIESEADSLSYIASVRANTGEYAEALDIFSEVLAIALDHNLYVFIGRSHHNIGQMLSFMGEYDDALAAFEKALEIERQLGDRQAVANTLMAVAQVYQYQGNVYESLDIMHEALEIIQQIGDRTLEGDTINAVGAAYFALARYDDALEQYNSALLIADALGDVGLQRSVLNNLGAVQDHLGEYARAHAYYDRALAISREIGDLEGEAAALANNGVVFWREGEYESALVVLQSAVELLTELDDKRALALTLVNIGNTYAALGNVHEALDYYEQAIEIQETIGALGDRARTQVAIAYYLQLHGQFEQAIELYSVALETQRELGMAATEGITLNNLGYLYFTSEDFETALTYFETALATAREIGDRQLEAILRENIAATHHRLGESERAIDNLRDSIAIDEEIGNSLGLASSAETLASIYQDLGERDNAIAQYMHAIELRESLFEDVRVDEFRSNLASQEIDSYAQLLLLLLDGQQVETAFEYSERARARVLLAQLAAGRINFRAGVSGNLLEEEQELRSAIAARREQLLTLRNKPVRDWDISAIDATTVELQRLEQTYASLLTELKLQSPKAADLVSVDPVDLDTVQEQLPPNTTLLSYFVTDRELVILVLSQHSLVARRVEIDREQLIRTIVDFREFISLDDPHPQELQLLHGWLIEPVRDLIQSDALAVVPHGPLHYVPFSALSDGIHYLHEDFVLYTLPSVSTLSYLLHDTPPDYATVLAFGNPTSASNLPALPFAAEEASVVADLYATTALVGEQATEAELRRSAMEFDIIHIAAHGELNASNPLFSTLHLAADGEQDGRLEVHEIYALDLTSETDLVVLSACESNLGELSAGDELVGLNRAFIYAGANSVVASLWNVDDRATSLLMQEMYRLLRAGAGPAQALAHAQTSIRAQYPHPYYWAAFVLTGDGGEHLPQAVLDTVSATDDGPASSGTNSVQRTAASAPYTSADQSSIALAIGVAASLMSIIIPIGLAVAQILQASADTAVPN